MTKSLEEHNLLDDVTGVLKDADRFLVSGEIDVTDFVIRAQRLAWELNRQWFDSLDPRDKLWAAGRCPACADTPDPCADCMRDHTGGIVPAQTGETRF